MGRYSTILLKDDNLGDGYEEARCGATSLYPGMFAVKDTDGTLIPHATAGGNVGPLYIVIEDGLRGDTTVDTAYTVGQLVRYLKVHAGGKYAILLQENENANIGSPLASNGDGTFQIGNGTTEYTWLVADEDYTATGEDELVKAIVQ